VSTISHGVGVETREWSGAIWPADSILK
jgi:hypothetical protein